MHEVMKKEGNNGKWDNKMMALLELLWSDRLDNSPKKLGNKIKKFYLSGRCCSVGEHMG